jgi:hypothetical protein
MVEATWEATGGCFHTTSPWGILYDRYHMGGFRLAIPHHGVRGLPDVASMGETTGEGLGGMIDH